MKKTDVIEEIRNILESSCIFTGAEVDEICQVLDEIFEKKGVER